MGRITDFSVNVFFYVKNYDNILIYTPGMDLGACLNGLSGTVFMRFKGVCYPYTPHISLYNVRFDGLLRSCYCFILVTVNNM